MMVLSALSKPILHHSQVLELIFEHCFGLAYNTCLQGGAEEPEYVPAATAGASHRIIFTRDYFASALHEVAHWCVAGEQRRLLPDYGYWYSADGRNAQQQAEFERVEAKPQALEWLFAQACGSRFRVSADNLASGMVAGDHFQQAVVVQAQQYCQQIRLPFDATSSPSHSTCQRAGRFIFALSQHYGVATERVLNPQHYHLNALSSSHAVAQPAE